MSEVELSPMGEAALGYAHLGWAVFPTFGADGVGACACGCNHPHCWRRAKHARSEAWDTEATTDDKVVAGWWTRWPAANVAVHCGRSALVVIDIDRRDGAGDRLAAVVRRFGPGVLETAVAETGGGGHHIFFAALPGPISPRKDFLGDGIDIAAGRFYVTLPPSVHVMGGQYRWMTGKSPVEFPIAPLPAAIAELLRRRPPLAWYVRMAPYWAADRMHLSLDNRARLRRFAGRLRGR